ncbi:restriction endonuclease subunit S [Vibrio sp. 947]|uniref:restriction endonuclease subunit S n=1 Tax=Vibrio sp. 947 TaxID=3074619 RepID=UPI002964E901|nr:restriction endonuclease subunit S [Vibrio sp. 947]MDW1927498.1 restriction endonuclease subunit S [Vibrio sp. 947]
MIQIKLKNCIETYSGYAFSSKDFCDDGVQIIKIGNLFNNKLSLERSPTFVSEGFLLSHHEYIASEGDILISLTGTLGKKDYGYAVAIDKNCEFLVNQRVLKISAKHNITQEYLLFLLQSEYLLNELYPLANGTKQANISASDVLNIGVSLPSIDEQKSISKLLGVKVSIIDTKVKNLTQKLHHLEEYKTALIHNAVTKGLDANGCRILDGTPANEIRWGSFKVKDLIVENEKSNRPASVGELTGKYQFFKSSIKQNSFCDFYDYEKMSIVMGDGGVANASLSEKYFSKSDHCWSFYSNVSDLHTKFLFHFIVSQLKVIDDLGFKGMGIRNLDKNFVRNLEVFLPDEDEVLAINNFIEKNIALIMQLENAINKKIDLLLEYKKSLINEAVSGQ